ncbi:MAG: site-specific DNA-methyltransferase [Candidatus Thermoplasmatota archaeon]|nr:site-specific DNA-methyltransferase [Candidatus Thermoplasmatota archaeon]
MDCGNNDILQRLVLLHFSGKGRGYAMPLTTVHRLMESDALVAVDGLEECSVHITVTSPPYPMIRMWDSIFSEQDDRVARAFEAQDGEKAFEAIHSRFDQLWSLLHSKTSDGGILCINIGDATRSIGGRFRYFSNHARIISGCVRAGFDMLPEIVWRKQSNRPNKFLGSGMLPPTAYPSQEHEFILIFRKGGPRRFENTDARARRRRSAFFWEERNRWFSDLWDDIHGVRQNSGSLRERNRTAAYPAELPYRLINMFSIIGDTVLDPFSGTGSTSVAAAASCRNSISVESSESLVSMSSARMLDCIDECVSLVSGRIASHIKFISSRDRRGKHRSQRYGFGVVSSQERDIAIPVPLSVSADGEGRFTVLYEE